MKILDKVKMAIENFEAQQDKYREFGAWDTEPSQVFHLAVAKSVTSGVVQVPKFPSEWKLYTETMKCGKVAISLSSHAKKTITIILKYWKNKEIQDYVKGRCWRASF